MAVSGGGRPVYAVSIEMAINSEMLVGLLSLPKAYHAISLSV